MIRLLKEEDEKILDKIIEKDIFQNIYIYIDTQTYGYNSNVVKTYILESNNNLKMILYHYYDSLQIFSCDVLDEFDINEIISHIKEYNFKMISGVQEVIEPLYEKLTTIYKMSMGYVLKKEKKILELKRIPKLADENDFEEISKLICSDKNIGGHYTWNQLADQFLERKRKYDCKNVIIKKNNEIICHMGVYANCKKISVLGGLITKEKYRGLGYGKNVLDYLTKLVQDENKVPVLYCYDENIINWYKKLGWEYVNSSCKLEKL